MCAAYLELESVMNETARSLLWLPFGDANFAYRLSAALSRPPLRTGAIFQVRS